MDCLVQHFRPALEGNDFDFAAVAGELSALKACVTANDFKHLDPLILWQRMFTMKSDSGQYCEICFRGVDYSCHGMAPSLAVGWESFVVEWDL